MSSTKPLSLVDFLALVPDENAAEEWIASLFWPNGPECPHCGCSNIQSGAKHKSMPYRCRREGCRKRFSLKIGTVLRGTRLPYRIWAIAIYRLVTSPKGVSSRQLAKELGIQVKSAWHLTHRIRKGLESAPVRFLGPVEVDETCVGGLEKNKHRDKRQGLGRGGVGKSIVVGAYDRNTRHVPATVVEKADKATLHAFVHKRSSTDANVYSDDHAGYRGVAMEHGVVRHSRGEYGRGPVNTNAIESVWALLKRAHKGTYHQWSKKHLVRYVQEFVGRHNIRGLPTLDQCARVLQNFVGKRLRLKDLTA